MGHVKTALELTKLAADLVKSVVEAGTSLYEAHQKYKEAKANHVEANEKSIDVPVVLTKKQEKKAEEEYEKALASLIPYGEGSMTGEMNLKTIELYYKGVFVDGELEGYGEMRTRESSYLGYFQDGLPHGEGKMILTTTGSIMIGNFENGTLNGVGQMITKKGSIYSGTFETNQFAEGTLITSSGIEFVGKFKNYWPEEGTATYTSGLVYKGRMKDWKWNDNSGAAILTYPKRNKKTGSPYKATYYCGEFKEATFDGQGEMAWRNGKKWTGEWVTNEMQKEKGEWGIVGNDSTMPKSEEINTQLS